MNNNYDDIINLPHHISKKHPQMSIEARAAQFAPYAALTGYEDVVKETARLTNERIELDEEVKQVINEKIQIIKTEIKNMPEVCFTYFIPDCKKQGGEYVKVIGKVRKIDEYNQKIILENNSEIPINELIDISEGSVKNRNN